MLLAHILPAGTPPLIRLAIEVALLLLAARLLLGFIRRARVGVLALAAAAWVWFFYPLATPGCWRWGTRPSPTQGERCRTSPSRPCTRQAGRWRQ
jgi:hypothetical protein